MIARLTMIVMCLWVSAASAQVTCMDRVSGGTESIRKWWCTYTEHTDWGDALYQHWLATGVNPLDHSACKKPWIEFRTHDLITRSCNQNPASGRDLHSCGAPRPDGRYRIWISYQAHMDSQRRWYRDIQLSKFFYWCTGAGIPEWPWWEIPPEWS